MFGIPQRAVCFTENSPAALEWLIAENRYEPFGLGFTKDTVFAHRGGPVLEIRGDEWPKTEFWADELRARTKRFWPGAMAKKLGGTPLPLHISRSSEWSFEREWRVPLVDFSFEPTDLNFVVCDSLATRERIAMEVERTDGDMAARVRQVMCYWWNSPDGRLVQTN